MKKITQSQMVKSHLLRVGSITTFDAHEKYACTRLATRIFELKELGMNIVSKPESATDRYGNIVHYVRYHLVTDKNNSNE